jgi:hypothetical protein
MHQSVVEYEVASAAMSVVPSASAERSQPRRRFKDLPQDERTVPAPEIRAPGFSPRDGAASLWSYVTAACIAAGLVAAWLGLSLV